MSEGSPSEVPALLAAARSGDADALDQLFRRYLGRLRAFVRLRMDPDLRAVEQDADIVQSTCRELVSHFADFAGTTEPELVAWLFTTALNKVRTKRRFWRRDRRAPAHGSAAALDPDLTSCYAVVLSPSQDAIGRETAAQLERAFDALSDEHREVITLARIVGLSHAEIGIHMGRSEAATRQLLVRALRRLADEMDRRPW